MYIKKGCEFLELPAPKNLDEALDGLLILYSHVPSITTFPVYIGRLDMLLDPFITDEEQDYIKIKPCQIHSVMPILALMTPKQGV